MDVNRKIILQPKRKSATENNWPKKRSWMYHNSYLGFTFIF